MKSWGQIAGSAFAGLIMGVVLYLYGGDLRKVDLAGPGILPRLTGAVGIYLVVVVMGALSWGVILRALGAAPAPWTAERQLLVSQIGKYIPGNIAQYLGRAAMTINSGVPAKTVGLALIIETAVIIAGGFLSVAASIALFPDLMGNLSQAAPDQSRTMWLGASVAIFLILVIGLSLASSRSGYLRGLPKVGLGGLFLATFLSTVSFLLLGISLHMVVGALSSAPVPISLSVVVFAAAWIAGLATPGAPGGLGVRESVLTIGLAPFVGGANALAAALLYRGVSVIGDVVALALGLFMPNRGTAPNTKPRSFDGVNRQG